MKIVDLKTVLALSEEAKASPRQRMNLNFHGSEEDPVQRFLNAIEPGSYVRPHRHIQGKWELFVVLSGGLAVLLFDDAGVLAERVELRAGGPNVAAEIPDGAWHTIAALEPGTVLFEIKKGPYSPLSDKDFASWAPREGDPLAGSMALRFARAEKGEIFT